MPGGSAVDMNRNEYIRLCTDGTQPRRKQADVAFTFIMGGGTVIMAQDGG